MRCKIKTLNRIFLSLACLLTAGNAVAQGQFYRYINDDGVKVIASAIPPRFVSRGYEILSPNGQVLKVVKPAPAPEDLARVEQERALLETYEILARRYSSADDIIAARDRRLAHLDANIAILRANIGNLNHQIEDLMSRAASSERSGRAVPEHLLNSLTEIRAELSTTENMLRMRLDEHQEIFDKFAADIALFEQGRSLSKSESRPATAR